VGRPLYVVVTSLMFAATAASCRSTDTIEPATSSGLVPSSAQATEQLATEPQTAGTDLVSSAPAPGDMCDAELEPVLAAYDIDDGDLRWVACTPVDPVRRGILDVSAEVVWIELISPNGEQRLVGYAKADGTAQPAGPDAPSPPTRTGPAPWPEVDGVRIVSPQEGPTSGEDAASGSNLWTQPGSSVYDDVVASGDGAVFVIDRQTADRTVVAYEVRTGAVRWRRDLGRDNYAWPWHVKDGRLFAIWDDIIVVSTGDGSVLWRTRYPEAEFPRMTGVDADGETVFVAFSALPSGGD
jgi:hypothetical protein